MLDKLNLLYHNNHFYINNFSIIYYSLFRCKSKMNIQVILHVKNNFHIIQDNLSNFLLNLYIIVQSIGFLTIIYKQHHLGHKNGFYYYPLKKIYGYPFNTVLSFHHSHKFYYYSTRNYSFHYYIKYQIYSNIHFLYQFFHHFKICYRFYNKYIFLN